MIRDLNTLYLVSCAILITKVVDNYLYSIIEENVGINLIAIIGYVCETLRTALIIIKKRLRTMNEIIEFVDIYRDIRNSNR
jgi:hypothetical protein